MTTKKTVAKIIPYLLLLPPLLFILSMVVYPFLVGIKMSVTNYKTGEFNNFHNFIRATQDTLFFDSLKAITIYVTVVITIEFFLGLALALVIYRFVKSGFIKVIFYLLFLQ